MGTTPNTEPSLYIIDNNLMTHQRLVKFEINSTALKYVFTQP
jgi:hypothetical protein